MRESCKRGVPGRRERVEQSLSGKMERFGIMILDMFSWYKLSSDAFCILGKSWELNH